MDFEECQKRYERIIPINDADEWPKHSSSFIQDDEGFVFSNISKKMVQSKDMWTYENRAWMTPLFYEGEYIYPDTINNSAFHRACLIKYANNPSVLNYAFDPRRVHFNEDYVRMIESPGYYRNVSRKPDSEKSIGGLAVTEYLSEGVCKERYRDITIMDWKTGNEVHVDKLSSKNFKTNP